ncbi:gamma-glutamyltransferase [Alteromonas sp. ASW11-130]|uniref:gamma-glutamyltransferase n=1 Tax=Alteromonas sp. ASW11-130 TaxID=3015775 RepID=UPI002241BA32|nr:gamma-glutamyltransferase [Alteromonas sp. ASW11-130]MCW8090845.1 gamma-glutamyltransferase [Alteromonas sp. ASW11-130]
MRLFAPFLFALTLTSCAANDSKTLLYEEHAVAMPDTFSAEAAMDVLLEGGNAVDAAITAQFVLAVTLPEAGNIGGGGFMTLLMDGEPSFLDYREMAPENATRDMYLDENGDVKTNDSLYGARAAGVPGTVAGMWAAHNRYGTLPWARLLQPAVTLAEEGFKVPQALADNVVWYQKKLADKKLASNFDRYFGHMKANETFRQPELASTLRRIQEDGRAGFYDGKTAQLINTYMQHNNGLINEADLKNYEAAWREPLIIEWQDYQVVTSPAPSSGGVAVAQILGMFAQRADDFEKLEHNSAEYLHLMAEISKRVFADRAQYMGDPDFVNVPQTKLINDEYIQSRAAEISLNAISATESIRPGLQESEDTTHFSIVDKWGNAVANTTTINLSFGSGVVVDGAGFLLNDEMDDFSAKPGVPNFFGAVGGKANEIQPHKRMLSSMTPTLVLKGDTVKLVTGSPGGTTIISSVAQSILSSLYFNLDADQAVNLPRFHHQLLPKDTIRVHQGFDETTLKELSDMGYVLDKRRFGDLQLIKRTATGLEAASEENGRGRSLVIEIDNRKN